MLLGSFGVGRCPGMYIQPDERQSAEAPKHCSLPGEITEVFTDAYPQVPPWETLYGQLSASGSLSQVMRRQNQAHRRQYNRNKRIRGEDL